MGGVSKQLKIPPGVGLGGGEKFPIYFLEGGGGPGNMETPLEPYTGPLISSKFCFMLIIMPMFGNTLVSVLKRYIRWIMF